MESSIHFPFSCTSSELFLLPLLLAELTCLLNKYMASQLLPWLSWSKIWRDQLECCNWPEGHYWPAESFLMQLRRLPTREVSFWLQDVPIASSLPVYRRAWSIPIRRSTDPVSRWWILFPFSCVHSVTALLVIADTSSLIRGIPTAFRRKPLLLLGDVTCSSNSFVFISYSSPPTFVIVMETFLPSKPRLSAVSIPIQLIYAPESRSTFPRL